MNVTIVRVVLGVSVSLVLLAVINRMVFSWTGLVFGRLGLCEYKSIGVSALNSQNQKLSQSYDPAQIASTLSANRNYTVNLTASGTAVHISRTFNGVPYNMLIDNRTPSYALERNVYAMIDDLPLSNLQRDELKQQVKVSKMSTGKLAF